MPHLPGHFEPGGPSALVQPPGPEQLVTAQNPQFQGVDFLPELFGGQGNLFMPGNPGLSGFSGNPATGIGIPLAATAALPLQQATQIAAPTGLATLLNILASQGRTDPGLFNMQLQDIAHGTANQQAELDARLARAGLTGSGLGQAVGAAIGQGGQRQRTEAIAQEAALTEQRKRQDLQLLQQIIFGNALGFLGTGLGAPQQQGDDILGPLLGAAGTVLGGVFGGPAGAAAGGAVGGAIGGGGGQGGSPFQF